MIGAREAGIAGVHDSRRNPGQPQRPGLADNFALKRMRRVRAFVTPGWRCDVNEDTPAIDPHREGGNAVLLEARLAQAGAAMEFPAMPRADDVILIKPAVAQRAADVIAGVRHRAPGAVVK